MRLIEMFSSRGSTAYALTPNYAYQANYPGNYGDLCAEGHLAGAENAANGNYQQANFSWPAVYAVANGPAGRPSQPLYDDWVSTAAPCGYQAQPLGYNAAYHAQGRGVVDNFPNQAPATEGCRSGGQPSPESAVAVSSDGLSGSESPELSPLHLSSGNGTVVCRPQVARSPFEWMKRSSYQSQPNPGKTRTKDKYRVVYTDHQRLELEKEFHYSRYITIRRKSELAGLLGLSERQVKIWFQNRRAKERKQAKKREEIEQKNKDALMQQTNAINMSSLNFLRPLSHFDHENNNVRNMAMFPTADHLCK